jgi:uncharacterized protein with ParB-like and HNH nuclease domain
MQEEYKEKVQHLESAITSERKRLSSDRLDISFGELINLYKNKELIITPEYQRLFRWTSKQKTDLIESILLSIPVPPIFVAEDKDGVWELVDGLQRVSTFISFFGDLEEDALGSMNQPRDTTLEEVDEDTTEGSYENKNKWVLESGGLIKQLQGFNIDTLPANLKINLKRAVCRVEILRGESTTSMKYELFKRLNSGGSKLTPQEIRNAIYRGLDPRLNELLLKISKDKIFKDLTKLTLSKLNELYDQELVLRFFAFFENTEEINENTENFLNSFMENAVKNSEFDYNSYEQIFTNCLRLINALEDANVFRTAKNAFVPAYFEGIMIGLAQNIDRYSDTPSGLELLRHKINSLKEDEDFKRFSGVASNSKSRIKNRLRRANKIFES